ncbi:MAG: hypothetical protein ACJ8AW_42170 [Rhodopila sp.]
MPQENWFLSLDPAICHYASETMLQLLGFKTARFGRFYGTSPYYPGAGILGDTPSQGIQSNQCLRTLPVALITGS